MQQCWVEWCNKEVRLTKTRTFAISGLCKLHETREYRDGSPTPPVMCRNCKVVFPYTFPGTFMVKQGGGSEQKHYCTNCTKIIEDNRDWLPDSNTISQLLYFYKLDRVAYLSLLLSQNFCCGMCRLPLRGMKKTNVDHDHSCCPGRQSCGECVRGVICTNCNILLGRYDSNPKSFDQMFEYLDRFNSQRNSSGTD